MQSESRSRSVFSIIGDRSSLRIIALLIHAALMVERLDGKEMIFARRRGVRGKLKICAAVI